ncbi:MAG TPA: SRPBCC family protein [Caulifigura sp.]|nr:SRPBCC family protein [Caulifigura sp.]
MTDSNSRSAVLQTTRLMSATPLQVYAAFENPEALATWWGPEGFTNSFRQFEFRPGGKWVFVMHGPNGVDYDNESVFRVLEPGSRIVIEHIAPPWFTLTVTLSPRGGQTLLTWEQEFENADVAEKLGVICKPANEQNLDRLEAVLQGGLG